MMRGVGGWAVAVRTPAPALVLAVGLFFIIPVTATNLIKDQLGSAVLFWIVEGVLRTAIFLLIVMVVAVFVFSLLGMLPWWALIWPGLKLQLLTTREPSLDQLAVAIVA